MDTIIGAAVDILRHVPAILAFFIPALLGMALLKERGERNKTKAIVVFLVGFGSIIGMQVLIRSISTFQVLATIGVSLTQVAVALLIAAFIVYKLAD